jgi:hypothetical protein
MKNRRSLYIALIFIGGFFCRLNASTFFVNGAVGNDLWDGSALTYLSGSAGPKATLFAAISAATDGDTVYVADGVYSGPGNVDLQFNGRSISLKSLNGPETCAIDCQGSHRAFLFNAGENDNCIINGFTIINGLASAGGAIKCAASSPTIKNCVIRANRSQGSGPFDNGGGAIYCTGGANPTFINCFILNNISSNWGGGIFVDNESTATFLNCLIAGNQSANYGGGIYGGGSSELNIFNCTIVENSAVYLAGGVRGRDHCTINIANSILWNNIITDTEAGDGPAEIVLDGTAVLSLAFSTVKNGMVYANDSYTFPLADYGVQNSAADPLFTESGGWNNNSTPADPSDDTWINGDYHLQALSLCRNTGNDESVSPDDPNDLDGNPRIVGSAVDRGAFEEAIPDGADLTGKFGLTTLQQTILPGDKASAAFSLSNIGNQIAEGSIDIDFYFSDDPYWDESDSLLTELSNLNLKLNSGETNPYTAKLVVPPTVGAGNHYLLAVIDPANTILESDEGPRSNTIIEVAPHSIVWQFGDVAGRKNVKLTVYDSQNVPVTFSLKGGWGEIAGDGQFDEIVLHNTTARSAFSISTKGKNVATSIGTLRAQDGGLKSIVAKTTDLRGDVQIAGTLAQLEFRDVVADTPATHVIQIQGEEPVTGKEAVSLKFRNIRDLSVISPALPVKSLMCAEWRKTNDLANVIETPRLDKAVVTGNSKSNPAVAGDFDADLNLTGPADIVLGAVKIAGTLQNAVWDIAGNASSIAVGALDKAAIFLGVRPNLPQFTKSAGDFTDRKYSLKSLTITGADEPSFTGSQLAAWTIDKLTFPAGASGVGFYIQYHELTAKNTPTGVELAQVP